MGIRMLAILAALLVLAPVVLLLGLSLASRRPSGLGPRDGRLSDCPATPNCVSSSAGDPEHRVDPLPYQGEASATVEAIAAALSGEPRTRIVTRDDGYLHAEATSRVFRFVDDVEFLADPAAGVIHVRSASRVGRSDLGVNRRRVERIRQALARRAAGAGPD